MYFRTYLRKTKSSKKSNYTKLASLPIRDYVSNSF
ncbi:haloacid dehalogenase [Mycoplasmoides gallisepticum]|nr:haloacid dehalogenase [Mycoplasmoides gallisepticum]